MNILVYDVETSKCLYFADVGIFCRLLRVSGNFIYQWESSVTFNVWEIPSYTMSDVKNSSVTERIQRVSTYRLATPVGFDFLLEITSHKNYSLGVLMSSPSVISIWDATDGTFRRMLFGHRGTITSLEVHKDTIISASRDKTVILWDLHTGEKKVTLNGHLSKPKHVRLYKNTAVSWTNSEVIVWDIDTGLPRKIFYTTMIRRGLQIAKGRMRQDVASLNLLASNTVCSSFYSVISDVCITDVHIIFTTHNFTFNITESGRLNRLIFCNLDGEYVNQVDVEGDTVQLITAQALPGNRLFLSMIDYYALGSSMFTFLDFQQDENPKLVNGSFGLKPASIVELERSHLTTASA
jgi:WD40 repeat protein